MDQISLYSCSKRMDQERLDSLGMESTVLTRWRWGALAHLSGGELELQYRYTLVRLAKQSATLTRSSTRGWLRITCGCMLAWESAADAAARMDCHLCRASAAVRQNTLGTQRDAQRRSATGTLRQPALQIETVRSERRRAVPDARNPRPRLGRQNNPRVAWAKPDPWETLWLTLQGAA